MATAEGGVAPIYPGKGLGFIILGASLYDVLGRLRVHNRVYPSINIIFDKDSPLTSTISIELKPNGIRLGFDGVDQRLRLIEVLDFQKTRLSYNGSELVRTDSSPPSFKSLYNKLFGPTFPGEFLADQGLYVLSYPGVAFSFPLDKSHWSDKVDFVSLLSSKSKPAASMAIFAGSSWVEARPDLYTRPPSMPRNPVVNSQAAKQSTANDEVELVRIHGQNRIELIRRHNAPFWITLHSTTAQDLVAELGPPSSIYRKNDHRLSIHRAASSGAGQRPVADFMRTNSSDYTDTETEDPQSDGDDAVDDSAAGDISSAGDHFYNYFNHGFDIFISTSPSSSSSSSNIATKIILHGNLPGSYDFQRYRRARWTIENPTDPQQRDEQALTSEMMFDEIRDTLRQRHGNPQKPMLLNRGNDSPSSSCELLGGWEDSEGSVKNVGETLGNTELYGFPGMIFEVMKNRTVSSLTVF